MDPPSSRSPPSPQLHTHNRRFRLDAPTAWVVPVVTGGDNHSGAIVEDETVDAVGNKGKAGVADPTANDGDGYGHRYQTSLYTVVVNETRELRLQCTFIANPDKLRTPVKWSIRTIIIIILCIV